MQNSIILARLIVDRFSEAKTSVRQSNIDYLPSLEEIYIYGLNQENLEEEQWPLGESVWNTNA